ncbi:uncharacterized protein LOC142224381 [Haematobia irritans]|uniref:uncharacterized protein LOC142224381 n=1 Tax=Haematobia irritans TaxID=7368 RepID=UPI003F4F9025
MKSNQYILRLPVMLLLVVLSMKNVASKWCIGKGDYSNSSTSEIALKNTLSPERYCCPGYILKNKICVFSNRSECKTGFIQDHKSGDCKPLCKSKCSEDSTQPMCKRFCYRTCSKFKKCFSPGLMNETYLEPQVSCNSMCGYGECLTPDSYCQCHQGYELNNITLLCDPVCTEKCPANSHCILPNLCECNKGFHLDNITNNQCKSRHMKMSSYASAIASGGRRRIHWNRLHKHGQYKNECDHGFEFNPISLRCQPACHNGCLNGNCTSPDVCICWKGFSMDMITLSCQPNQCKNPCPHGYCTPTGECLCPEGLTKSIIRDSGCEPLLDYTAKVIVIFLCVLGSMMVVIYLITLAERRRRRILFL